MTSFTRVGLVIVAAILPFVGCSTGKEASKKDEPSYSELLKIYNLELAALDRLRDYEPAFALTVHKSQGTEFDNVLLVLPEQESPLLSRQIIYTGITRAKNRVRIIGSSAMLKTAIKRRATREGGLRIG